MYRQKIMNKILYHSVRLRCNTKRAFDMFTMNAHLQKWLTVKADVEPRVGGKFELFWNPKDRKNDSTIGCKITAIEKNKFLAFEWKGPKEFEHFMNNADPLTHVVIFFIPYKKTNVNVCTEIHLFHSGWRSTPEWEKARLWFNKAWKDAFAGLRKYPFGVGS